jgi:hypothetical protein
MSQPEDNRDNRLKRRFEEYIQGQRSYELIFPPPSFNTDRAQAAQDWRAFRLHHHLQRSNLERAQGYHMSAVRLPGTQRQVWKGKLNTAHWLRSCNVGMHRVVEYRKCLLALFTNATIQEEAEENSICPTMIPR